jgi:hypothetical protein
MCQQRAPTNSSHETSFCRKNFAGSPLFILFIFIYLFIHQKADTWVQLHQDPFIL